MKAGLQVYITRTITDTKTGKVIKRYRKRLSKSFVKQWMQLLQATMGHAYAVNSPIVTIKDTSNVEQSYVQGSTDGGDKLNAVECAVGSTTYGIVVGIGTTAPTVTDYMIETAIAEGGGAGQMNYGATSVSAVAVSAPNVTMSILRAMVNNSGGTITVKEVGMIIYTDTSGYAFLAIRDAVDDAVNDGQTYTVTYTFTTTV